MDINIREHICNNFKDSSGSEIQESIEESIASKDEVVLPGLGVFFELIWNNCSDAIKDEIISIIQNHV